MGNRNHGLNVLGLNVRRWREEMGLTQEALAERADLDPTYISGIERGLRNPSVLSVVRIARALGVTTSRLMENVDEELNERVQKPSAADKKFTERRHGGGSPF